MILCGYFVRFQYGIPRVPEVMRLLKNLASSGGEFVEPFRNRIHFFFCKRFCLITQADNHAIRYSTGSLLYLQVIALFFGPDEGLCPMNPGTSQLYRVAGKLRAECSAAQPVTRLQQQGAKAIFAAVPGSADTGESPPDNDYIVVTTGCFAGGCILPGHRVAAYDARTA